MPSTFFGLNIGVSGLHSFHAAINTTANNLSNVQTTGYSRQTANMSATNAIRVTARYGSMGTGVAVTSITQERNLYYDDKYWRNNASHGYYEEKLYYIDQMEQVLLDDSVQEGFTTIFNKMFNGLDTLKTNAADVNVRNQFIGQAQSLCMYFNVLNTSLSQIQDDCNEEIKNSVDKINSLAQKISLLNKEINQLETGTGAHANELRDERANLIDELSHIVDVTTAEYEVENTYGENLGGTDFTLEINGQILVHNKEFRTLECISSDYTKNQTDNQGLYSIIWSDTKMNFAATTGSANGILKSLFDMRDGDNADNVEAQVAAADGANGTVTIGSPDKPLNVDVKALNLAGKDGSLTINNVTYYYSSFDATVDTNGKVTSITFNMVDGQLPDNADEFMIGKDLVTGSGVDSMGIPYYQAQINEFIRTFSELFNMYEQSGENLYGDNGPAFFVASTATGKMFDFDLSSDLAEYDGVMPDKEYDEKNNKLTYSSGYTFNSYYSDSLYQLMASNFAVNKDVYKDPNLFGAKSKVESADGVVDTGSDKYDLIEKMLKLQSDVKMFRGDKAGTFLETLLSDLTVDANKASIYYDNYDNLKNSIGNQRTSISGVDEDEEALNLVKFQNAYNLNSKVISVMAELYDKLINETGV